jgi:hypothetical protein
MAALPAGWAASEGSNAVCGLGWRAGVRAPVRALQPASKRKQAMRNAFKNTALALGLSGAMAFGTMTSLSAAPVPSATLAASTAAPDHTTNVYWRGRWGWGGGLLAAGLAAGFIGAAATAAYGGYYPSPAYAYPPPAYVYATYAAYPRQPQRARQGLPQRRAVAGLDRVRRAQLARRCPAVLANPSRHNRATFAVCRVAAAR